MHQPKPQIPANHEGPLLVIAAGMPRCATTTLKEIFEHTLAIGPTMHMNRVLPSPTNMGLVLAALKEQDKTKRQQILRELMTGYACTADFPGHLFVEDLIEMYPEAKVVLNIRGDGAAGWAKSMKAAIVPFSSLSYKISTYWNTSDYMHSQAQSAWNKKVRSELNVDTYWSEEAYDAHNAHVIEVCQEHNRDVLVWEPKMGWSPLCSFLELKEPSAPIPHSNERGQMEKVLKWRMYMGLQQWASKMVVPLSVVGGWGVGHFVTSALTV